MEITEELRREIDVTGAALLEQAEREPYPLRLRDGATVEAFMGGEHAPDWGPPFPDPMRPRVYRKAREKLNLGPNRALRNMARRVRVTELPERLKLTDGTGNLMVNICRSGARQAELDRAARRYQGPGGAGPHHPNERLRTFGLKVRGDWDNGGGITISGGTARQRACYLRSVERYMLWDYKRDEGA